MATSIVASAHAGRKQTRFYGKAEEAAQQILAAFQSGDLPKPLAAVFIRRKDDVPCRSWSWSNQLITALRGHSDARGYRPCGGCHATRDWGEDAAALNAGSGRT